MIGNIICSIFLCKTNYSKTSGSAVFGSRKNQCSSKISVHLIYDTNLTLRWFANQCKVRSMLCGKFYFVSLTYQVTHSQYVFFEFCFTDKYIKYVLKLIGLKIGDYGFLYVFVSRSKSIYARETYNTSFERSFHEIFRKVLYISVLQILFDLQTKT